MPVYALAETQVFLNPPEMTGKFFYFTGPRDVRGVFNTRSRDGQIGGN